jgi:hypothetical protein
MNWQEEAQALPPPSSDEIDDWADGIVYHQSADGVSLRYTTEAGWERA